MPPKPPPSPLIRLRGVRHNNLKNFDLDLPTGRLIVVTGLSGSGKSSLAFDTLYAEGQRRYVETFSPYARQFFDRMDKPQVDAIEGIPPAIAIEQRNAVRSTRSTVGTMTEICEYMKVLWLHLANLRCRQCGQPVRRDSPQGIWEVMTSGPGSLAMEAPRSGERTSRAREFLITFDLPISEKLSLDDSLALISRQGYQRLLVPVADRLLPETAGDALRETVTPFGTPPAPAIPRAAFEVVRVEEAAPRFHGLAVRTLTVVQDRLLSSPENRARFVEACEQAYHFGKGRLCLHELPEGRTPANRPGPVLESIPHHFSRQLHCARCDIEYREPSAALFSFNHPIGACPACKGFGRTITIDYNLALPDRSRTLAGGAIKPWQTATGRECQQDLERFCRQMGIPMDVPFRDLSPEHQRWVVEGDPDYGRDEEHEWPRAWYGVKGYFRWLESKAYKMHVRVLLSRYRAYRPCAECHGRRFQPDSLLYTVTAPGGPPLTLSDFYQLSITRAATFVNAVTQGLGRRRPNDPLSLVLEEVRSRLGYLEEVGLGYLTLDRPTRSLSGGETERVNLTTCLGSRLVNTLFVLDEPSVGLHPRDTDRLVRILERLRDNGNTVLVVEHEPALMRAADQIVDLGPGHGESGGQVVFQGSYREILKSRESLTGRYLSARSQIEIPDRRPVDATVPRLRLARASLHNLRDVAVEFPLGRLVCITGVSGSGKTTLLREIVLPLVRARLDSGAPSESTAARGEDQPETADDGDSDSGEAVERTGNASVEGWTPLGRAVLVDQSPLGRTPRSNPVVYIGAFEDIRDLFAQTELARERGINSSGFSFNSRQGQCESCRGAGFEKIEMQFLSDVYVRCSECNGRRYRPHILEVKLSRPARPDAAAKGRPRGAGTNAPAASRLESASIADLLDATVDEAVDFLAAFTDSRPAKRAVAGLNLLQETGLGYLRLGQPLNTLSGGESQRLKLVSHLVEFQQADALERKPTLFLFDEPTTGLHFEDVRVLLQVFQRLVDAGHSVFIIEHNLEVIKCADWLVDLGPEAGDGGGTVVVTGPPETVAACATSHTGTALRTTGLIDG